MIRPILALCGLCLLLSSTIPTAAAPAATWRGDRPYPTAAPGPTIEPYVRPGLAARMATLRPAILAAAARHNHAQISGMSDNEFAALIATILYNESHGWAEELAPPLRLLTPLYQDLQREANAGGLGSNFSVWPANLRPSVAAEILTGALPMADGHSAQVAVRVAGAQVDPAAFSDRRALYAAITAEISRDDLAVAYLAANLERGLLRAAAEGQPISWRTLAAWHNQGLVDPRAVRANPTARDYVRRASAYLPLARALVAPRAGAQVAAT